MSLIDDLKGASSSERAKSSERYFKTGKGQYGEGDLFIGVTVPECRKIAKKHFNLNLEEVAKHLSSDIHEERLVALLILVEKYKKQDKKEIVDFYLRNIRYVNNWDLVDLSAHKILGDYLLDKDKKILYEMAKSHNLWEKRIAIVSTFAFIAKSRFEESLKIIETLMNDKHDLIHKACGWVLREIGKKNLRTLEMFLAMHYKKMPRTMLRYSIEKFHADRRKKYLEGEI